VITRINPLACAVDPLRRVVFAAQNMPHAAAARFATGVSLFGYTLPTAAEVGIVFVFAVVFITLSVTGFGKPE
jgi:ABC-2 type transport system permease protein